MRHQELTLLILMKNDDMPTQTMQSVMKQYYSFYLGVSVGTNLTVELLHSTFLMHDPDLVAVRFLGMETLQRMTPEQQTAHFLVLESNDSQEMKSC